MTPRDHPPKTPSLAHSGVAANSTRPQRQLHLHTNRKPFSPNQALLEHRGLRGILQPRSRRNPRDLAVQRTVYERSCGHIVKGCQLQCLERRLGVPLDLLAGQRIEFGVEKHAQRIGKCPACGVLGQLARHVG